MRRVYGYSFILCKNEFYWSCSFLVLEVFFEEGLCTFRPILIALGCRCLLCGGFMTIHLFINMSVVAGVFLCSIQN